MTDIAGIDRLVRLRQAGKKPRLAFILVREHGRLGPNDFGISPHAAIDRLDLRPFVGMTVVIVAERCDGFASDLFRRLQDYADDVSLVVSGWLPGDCGLRRVRGETGTRGVCDGPI